MCFIVENLLYQIVIVLFVLTVLSMEINRIHYRAAYVIIMDRLQMHIFKNTSEGMQVENKPNIMEDPTFIFFTPLSIEATASL